jgi:hypothetical protein
MLERLLAKRHIRHLDLGSVREQLVEKQGWNTDQAERVEGDYKRFLYALAHKELEDVLSPPTEEVDQFWHQHILDTRKYREDCDTVFGHYVDHTPGLGQAGQREADARRREVYDEFDIDGIDFGSGDSPSHHSGDDCHSGDASHGCDIGGGHADAASAGGGGGGSESGGGDSGGGDGGSSCGGSGCGGGGCGGS